MSTPDLNALQAAVESQPNETAPRLILAEYYYRTGMEKKIPGVLEPLEQQYPFADPRHRMIYDRLLAFGYAQSNRFCDAERVCERALEEEPNGLDFLYIQTYVHLSMREYDKAIKQGQRCLDVYDTDRQNGKGSIDFSSTKSHLAQAANMVGSAYFEKASWSQAMAHFERSLEVDPGNHFPYINLAKIASNQGDLDAARRILSNGISKCREVQELRMLMNSLKQAATVSACMIVKDEEKLLPGCLDSIRSWVDEIIIVDTGSTDRTVEIAESYGAKVFHQPWEGNFSKHRNYSVELATCDWVFIIDADERMVEEDLPKLRRFMNQDDISIISINVFNVYGDKEEVTTFLPSVRFWRREIDLRYEGIVHNLLRLGEEHPVLRTSIRLKHLGYDLDERKMRQKFIRTKTLLEKQLEENPDNAFALFNYAQLLKSEKVDTDKKDVAGIMKAASRAVEVTDPENKSERHIHLMCLDQIAWAHFLAHEYDKAMEFCDRALAIKSNYLDPLMLKGHLYARQEMWDEAYEAFQYYLDTQRSYNLETETDCLILTHIDNRASALYGQALIWDVRNNKEEAKKSYLETIKEHPSYLEANLRLANIYLGEGSLMDAITHYERQLSVTPNSIDAVLGLAEAHRRQNDFEKTEQNFARAIEIGSGSPQLRLTYGRFLHEIGRDSDATEQFRLAIEKGEKSARVYCQLAETYSKLERYSDAAEAYEKAMEQVEPSAELLNDIANCYFKMKQYDRAEAYYQQALELDGSQSVTYRNLGLTQTGLEKYEEALVSLEKYTQMIADEADVLPIIGDIYAKIEQYDKALGFYERYLAKNPSAAHILYRLSDCYLNMGHTDSAIMGFRRVLQLNPEFEPARQRLDGLTQQALTS